MDRVRSKWEGLEKEVGVPDNRLQKVKELKVHLKLLTSAASAIGDRDGKV